MAFYFTEFSPILSTSGLELALDQPFFPGKIVLWLLFMLSLMSWAVMISKLVSFRKFREGDGLFTKQLRKSKKPLEIHEKSWEAPMSLRQEVYSSGAKEAAFQLLGTIRRQKYDRSNADAQPMLSDSQMASLREALTQGEKAAAARLDIGMPVLHASAAGAPFLGLLGMVWLMMGSFGAEGAGKISEGISAGLAVMAIGLIAATPAIFGQIVLRSMIRTRMRELGGFRMELFRLFERTLAKAWQVTEKPTAETPVAEASPAQVKETVSPFQKEEPATTPAPEEKPKERVTFEVEKPRRVKKKVFKPIRQDEPMINPIAMQAKSAQG